MTAVPMMTERAGGTRWRSALTQERIVLALAAVLFLIFSATLSGFLTPNNLLTLLRSVRMDAAGKLVWM